MATGMGVTSTFKSAETATNRIPISLFIAERNIGLSITLIIELEIRAVITTVPNKTRVCLNVNFCFQLSQRAKVNGIMQIHKTEIMLSNELLRKTEKRPNTTIL
jgi:hypothetical protein